MFSLEGKLTFINIEQNYLSKLYDVCSEVYYKSSDYDNKPYIGIMINREGRKYVIPFTSAKKKHKLWKNIDRDCFLVYEYVRQDVLGRQDIWVKDLSNENEELVKHILSVVDIKKMIPIVDGVYQRVDINASDNDSADQKKYKDLLNKEYRFCLGILDEVLRRVNKMYDKQMETGRIAKFCCNFKVLEQVADGYSSIDE